MIRTLPITLSSALELQNCPLTSVQLDISQLGPLRIAAQDFLSKTGCDKIRATGYVLKNQPLFIDQDGDLLNVDTSAYEVEASCDSNGVIVVFWSSCNPDAVNEWFFTMVSNMDFHQDTGRFLP